MAQPSVRPISDEMAQDLLRAAHAAVLLAHAPYSGVKVGAALLSIDGTVHTGCNVENASLGLTICAERTAVVKAVSSGQRGFSAIAIATSLEDALMPCGACRQFLFEFSPDLMVVTQGSKGPWLRAQLSDLLPKAFGPANLA